MNSVSILTVTGRVSKDPTSRTTTNGKQCVTVTIPVEVGKNDSKMTIWHEATFWGVNGDFIYNHIKKGDVVCVSGEQTAREHNGKTYYGINGNSVNIIHKGSAPASSDSGNANEPYNAFEDD